MSWSGVQEDGEGATRSSRGTACMLSVGHLRQWPGRFTGSMQRWGSPGGRMGSNPHGVQLDKTIDRSRHHWSPLTSFTVWTSPHGDSTCGQKFLFEVAQTQEVGSSNFRMYETP